MILLSVDVAYKTEAEAAVEAETETEAETEGWSWSWAVTETEAETEGWAKTELKLCWVLAWDATQFRLETLPIIVVYLGALHAEAPNSKLSGFLAWE